MGFFKILWTKPTINQQKEKEDLKESCGFALAVIAIRPERKCSMRASSQEWWDRIGSLSM